MADGNLRAPSQIVRLYQSPAEGSCFHVVLDCLLGIDKTFYNFLEVQARQTECTADLRGVRQLKQSITVIYLWQFYHPLSVPYHRVAVLSRRFLPKLWL